MKIGKRFFALFTTLLILVAVLAGCNKSAAPSNSAGGKPSGEEEASGEKELIKLRVAVMTGTFTQYTALIGKEQDIFKKYGIDLEITEYAAGINTIDAVVSGQADIGMMADFAAVNRIGNTLDSTNLILISEIQGGSVIGGLYVAPEYADNLSALSGKGFINSVGTVQEYYNSTVFQKLGFDEKQQKLLNSDGNSTSLALAQSGDASAVFASGASTSYYEDLGWKKALSAEELGIATYSYYLTTTAYNTENTRLIADFLTATQESYDYIVNHLEDAASYFESSLGLSAKDFTKDWTAAKSRIGFSEDGVKQLETIAAWAYQNDRYPKEYDIREYINTDALKIAYPDKITIQ